MLITQCSVCVRVCKVMKILNCSQILLMTIHIQVRYAQAQIGHDRDYIKCLCNNTPAIFYLYIYIVYMYANLYKPIHKAVLC